MFSTFIDVSVVKKCLADLDTLFEVFPKYRGYTIYGGVAGLTIDEEADKYAYRQGLFVLNVGREGLVTMLNDERFQPKDFGQK